MKYLADYGDTTDFVDGDGCFLIDKNGKRYLDFLGGWCVSTVGWRHPKMMALKNSGVYIPPSYSWPEWENFARFLADIAPGKLQVSFRCTSGSEAVELAMKIARAATGKKKIVSIDGVYHGHTYGAASVGRNNGDAMAPYVPDMIKLPMPHVARGVSASEVIQKFTALLQEEEGIAAFVTEPVWSNRGALVHP